MKMFLEQFSTEDLKVYMFPWKMSPESNQVSDEALRLLVTLLDNTAGSIEDNRSPQPTLPFCNDTPLYSASHDLNCPTSGQLDEENVKHKCFMVLDLISCKSNCGYAFG